MKFDTELAKHSISVNRGQKEHLHELVTESRRRAAVEMILT